MISAPARGKKIQGKAVVIYRPKSAALPTAHQKTALRSPLES